MKGKDLLSISDLTGDDILLLISDAVDMKAKGWLSVLDRKILAKYISDTHAQVFHSHDDAFLTNQILNAPIPLKGGVCPECEGKGNKMCFDLFTLINYKPCPTCHGTGHLPDKTKTVLELIDKGMEKEF